VLRTICCKWLTPCLLLCVQSQACPVLDRCCCCCDSNEGSEPCSQSAEDDGLCADFTFVSWYEDYAFFRYSISMNANAPQNRWLLNRVEQITLVFYDRDKKPLDRNNTLPILIAEEFMASTIGSSASVVATKIPQNAFYVSSFLGSDMLQTGAIHLPRRPLN
jgi:hypothetical protein